ncbi:hypothetical protein [Ammoniphilus resinae]|uniref:Uncharacterized protein n=1 Tax=Ammoniphilus resinae TaxID=861532 RepID=A0ABS4GMJ6_9BACL|nr:hypothetical protein [Ammoniphilus resinae]MBP1931489.1 hypothetical protein [Ammoniphilus resinae]
MSKILLPSTTRLKMIDQLLDTYNQYMALYQSLRDEHFKREADHAIQLIRRLL